MVLEWYRTKEKKYDKIKENRIMKKGRNRVM